MASKPGPQIERIRVFLEEHPNFSETATSLANKLGVDGKLTRRVLDELAESGELRRRNFERGIEPVYYRYEARAS
jgi:hypothetical protein